MKYGDSEWMRMADRRAVVQQARRKVADLNDWLISVRLERRRAAEDHLQNKSERARERRGTAD
jgi:hypothetical protein